MTNWMSRNALYSSRVQMGNVILRTEKIVVFLEVEQVACTRKRH